MDVASLKEKLKEEGFVHVFEWHDDPGTVYEAHSHEDKESMYILSGSLTLHFGDKTFKLKEGDRFDTPAGEEHTALIGPDGCDFLVGEMIEGDS